MWGMHERRAGPPQASERPLGGQRGHASAERGGEVVSAAPSRPKQANAPLGGSEDTPVPSVGAKL